MIKNTRVLLVRCNEVSTCAIKVSFEMSVDDEGGKTPVRITSFEDALEYVGGWGKYQFILLIMSLPFAMILAYAGYTPGKNTNCYMN